MTDHDRATAHADAPAAPSEATGVDATGLAASGFTGVAGFADAESREILNLLGEGESGASCCGGSCCGA